MLRLNLLLAFLCFFGTVAAQNEVHYTQDQSNSLNFHTAKYADYEPFTDLNFGLDNGIYWFKVQGVSQYDNMLELSSAHINEVTLFSNSGERFSDLGFTRFPTFSLDRFTEYPLYMRVNLEHEAFVPITLTAATTYLDKTDKAHFGMGVYYGFGIMVLLINLMCFILFDEKVFLKYLGFLSAIGLTYFYSDGLFRLFGVDGTFSATYLEPVMLLAVAVFGGLFASSYLRIDKHFSKVNWLAASLVFSAAVFYAMYWIKADYTYAAIANMQLCLVALTYIVSGIFLFKDKIYARIFVIAYGVVFIMATDYYMLKGFGLNVLNINMTHLKVVSVLEMLVLTYAIMFRMRSIKEEKDLMNTEMRIYLKRVEAINKRAVMADSDEAYLENLIKHYDLSATETRVLHYISDGKENHKIARILNITERQVENLTLSLYRKLEISEQIQEDYRMLDQQPDYIYN